MILLIQLSPNIHWTSTLLDIIIKWFTVINSNAINIKIINASKFKNKGDSEIYTILYNIAKSKPGMYQSVGFEATPPINIEFINSILYI